jgi:hypothetical protein
LFCNIINHAIESCKQEDHSCQKYHIALKRWITVYKRQAWDGKMDILDFYHQIMNDASAFSRNHSNHGDDTAYQVSLQFTRLLTAPEMWKKLQFVHIKNFPTMQW